MPVDLEGLAASYDHRPPSPAALDRAKRAAESAGLASGDVAVDIGGGRGHHAAAWGALGAIAIVVDPSQGMTFASLQHRSVVPVRGVAEQLPLRNSSARLAYFHLSIHYGDWIRAIAEAHRVLRPGGECWLWTMGEQHHRSSFLARWFPSVGDIDTARFPDPAAIVHELRDGWSEVSHGIEIEDRSMRVDTWRAAAGARFVSTLQLVPDREFAAGLAAFDAAHPDPDELVNYRLTFDWIRARK